MNTIQKLLAQLLFVGLFLIGCSEIKDGLILPSEAELKVHPNEFIDVQHDGFHGRVLRAQNWNWSGCQSCHGIEFDGGVVRISCMTSGCHVDFQNNPKPVTSCNTCHGDFRAAATNFQSFAPPRDLNKNTSTDAVGVGAHQEHLHGTIYTDGIRCSECHNIPSPHPDASFYDHLTPKGTDKVVFGELASFETREVDMTANPPTYGPTSAGLPSCSNTYCHGNFTGGNNHTVIWTFVNVSEVYCGTCHGSAADPLPKTWLEGGRHPDASPFVLNCQNCHYFTDEQGVRHNIVEREEDGTYTVLTRSRHVDGALHLWGNRTIDF